MFRRSHSPGNTNNMNNPNNRLRCNSNSGRTEKQPLIDEDNGSESKTHPHTSSSSVSTATRKSSTTILVIGIGLVVFLLGSSFFPTSTSFKPDAIVIGSGLAGLSATLSILDRGGTVILIEKEHTLGGNSNKASSGINACCNDNNNDTIELFRNDTTRSAGVAAKPPLIDTLITHSADAVQWLEERINVDLSVLAQLGGHSVKRTHRPIEGMVGAEIIYHMQQTIQTFTSSGQLQIYTDTPVTSLIHSGTTVIGVNYKSKDDGTIRSVYAPNIILATGGFASNRASDSYLAQYRPELVNFPATAGSFSTGDGITLGLSLGASLTDMEYVQLHPTGFVDPTDPTNPSKTLAAELTRGVGGILLNNQGQRFCNELGTRSYVTDQMLQHDPDYKQTGKWNPKTPVPTFALVLSSSAAAESKKHIDFYTAKGLLQKLNGIDELATWMNVSKTTLIKTINSYKQSAKDGIDEFGKINFRGLPIDDLTNEIFYAGRVTPVLHYCMGGLTIDIDGNVLNTNGEIIPGLHAAGEVSGGVHGVNRLGGNSLLECTVYGRIVGNKIPIQSPILPNDDNKKSDNDQKKKSSSNNKKSLPNISIEVLQKHNKPDDCWVAINGVVYDLTKFAPEHPAGKAPIYMHAGKDVTEIFNLIHNKDVLTQFSLNQVGIFV